MKRNFSGSSRLHLALNTSHFGKSVGFYEVLFNIKPSKIKPGYAKFEVQNPPLNLTLNEAKQVKGSSLNHMAIEVKTGGTVLQQNERLKKLGLETFFEESTTCCYAVQDKVWVKDPDGNSWETFVVLGEADDTKVSASCCNATDESCSSCGL